MCQDYKSDQTTSHEIMRTCTSCAIPISAKMVTYLCCGKGDEPACATFPRRHVAMIYWVRLCTTTVTTTTTKCLRKNVTALLTPLRLISDFSPLSLHTVQLVGAWKAALLYLCTRTITLYTTSPQEVSCSVLFCGRRCQ